MKETEEQKKLNQDLLDAVKRGKNEKLKELLEKGADLGAKDEQGRTAVHWASFFGNVTALETFIDYSPILLFDIADDNEGKTPLHYASMATSNGDKCVKILLDNFADKSAEINLQDKVGKSALHYAIQNDNPDVVKTLIDTDGINVDISDNAGRTPLHFAVLNAKSTCTKILLDNLAYPGTADIKGNYPLHYAVSNGNLEQVRTLLESGANVEIMDSAGRTPLKLAAGYKHRDIELLLRSKGAELEGIPVPEGMTLSDEKRSRKAEAEKQGPITPLSTPEGQKPTTPEILESKTFFRGVDNREEKFRGKEVESFQNPLLQPTKNVLALAKLGIRPPHMKQGKAFRSFGTSDKDVRGFAIPLSGVEGVYTHHNSVFFSAAPTQSLQEIWAAKEHEEAHFIMQEVFNNDSNPYPKDGFDAKLDFTFIYSSTMENIKSIAISKVKDVNEARAINSILSIESGAYTPEQRHKELIVKVSEIMGLLGNEKGYEWLKQNTPELLDFYENTINPALNKYLEAMEFNKYVDNSRILETQKEKDREIEAPRPQQEVLDNSKENIPAKKWRDKIGKEKQPPTKSPINEMTKDSIGHHTRKALREDEGIISKK